MKLAAHAGILGLVFSFFLPAVLAATGVTIANVPESIDKDQEIEIDIRLTCDGCTSDSYLRGAFVGSGTNYFGFTQNNSGAWTNASGTNCTEYYKVRVDQLSEGSWSGKLKLKPDGASSYYQGPGQYTLKVGRYTGGCGSPTWSNEVPVSITGTTSTPTPAPSATPTNSPVYTPTSTSTRTPTPTRTKTPTPTPEKAESTTSPTSARDVSVLGDVSKPSSDQTSSRSASHIRAFAVAFALVASGLGMLAAVLIWQKRKGTS